MEQARVIFLATTTVAEQQQLQTGDPTAAQRLRCLLCLIQNAKKGRRELYNSVLVHQTVTSDAFKVGP